MDLGGFKGHETAAPFVEFGGGFRGIRVKGRAGVRALGGSCVGGVGVLRGLGGDLREEWVGLGGFRGGRDMKPRLPSLSRGRGRGFQGHSGEGNSRCEALGVSCVGGVWGVEGEEI